jgi:glycosyltransferase involved in cell wall biosynthesis
MPRFSVVIPVYNRAGLIGPTLESVFRQSCTDYEVIVVDDGSTDSTWQALQDYGDRIRAFRQANAGPGAARNFAVAQAQGEYVAFLDSDDLWYPHTLANYARAIDQFERPAVVGGHVVMFADQSPEVPADATFKADYYADLLAYGGDFTRKMVTSCAVIRTDVLRRSPGFLTHNFIYDEYHLWVAVSTEAGFVLIDSPPSVAQRSHEIRISSSRTKAYKGALYLLQQEAAGNYPGGSARHAERRRLITTWVRNTAWAFAVRGYLAETAGLYFRSFRYQLADGQYGFLLRLPLTTAKGVLRRLLGRPAGNLRDDV